MSKRERCRTCQSSGIDGSLLERHFPELQPVEPLKWGTLFCCQRCGQHWYLDEERRWLHSVADTRLPRLRYWHENRLTVTGPILETLAQIGGVQSGPGGAITIPCQVGEEPRAVVLVTREPPLLPEKLGWGPELAQVSPSPCAVPLEVRRVAARTPEKSMGFAPVGVVDAQGTESTLGHRDCLFHERGPELRLSGRTRKWPRVSYTGTPAACYVVDWFPRCQELLVR